jgi:hypothetical protein
MANVLGGGSEWHWLAEHFAGGYLLAGYLLAGYLLAGYLLAGYLLAGALPLRHWRMQTAPGYWRRRQFASGESPPSTSRCV